MGNLQKVCRPCCYYNLVEGLSAGDRKTRYSRKSGHGRPDKGLAGTRDKLAKNRDVPVKSGRVATLFQTIQTSNLSNLLTILLCTPHNSHVELLFSEQRLSVNSDILVILLSKIVILVLLFLLSPLILLEENHNVTFIFASFYVNILLCFYLSKGEQAIGSNIVSVSYCIQ